MYYVALVLPRFSPCTITKQLACRSTILVSILESKTYYLLCTSAFCTVQMGPMHEDLLDIKLSSDFQRVCMTSSSDYS